MSILPDRSAIVEVAAPGYPAPCRLGALIERRRHAKQSAREAVERAHAEDYEARKAMVTALRAAGFKAARVGGSILIDLAAADPGEDIACSSDEAKILVLDVGDIDGLEPSAFAIPSAPETKPREAYGGYDPETKRVIVFYPPELWDALRPWERPANTVPMTGGARMLIGGDIVSPGPIGILRPPVIADRVEAASDAEGGGR